MKMMSVKVMAYISGTLESDNRSLYLVDNGNVGLLLCVIGRCRGNELDSAREGATGDAGVVLEDEPVVVVEEAHASPGDQSPGRVVAPLKPL